MNDDVKRRLAELAKQNRGTLLKDIEPEFIRILSDDVKAEGYDEGQVVPWNWCCYLKRATAEQLTALCEVFPHCTIQVRAYNGFRAVFAFDRKAIYRLMTLAGVTKPLKYITYC
jgi:hypothetical protein